MSPTVAISDRWEPAVEDGTSPEPRHPAPTITVTRTSGTESEGESSEPHVLSTPGNCYLSPFSVSSRGDRTTSESNLSSSGYSSMASPAPSRDVSRFTPFL